MDKSKKPICKNCGGKQIYARLKTKEFVCKTCGFIDKFNLVEIKK